MILYGLFFVLLSAFYMSAVSILRLAFDLFRVPVGVRSVAIAAGLLLICFPLIRKQSGAAALREVLAYALAWIPWLLYAALRTDFADSYAALLFGKMVVINFVSAVTVTVAYRVDPAAFGKFFFPVSVLFGIALLAEVLINPQVFIYATTIERLTIENANPIWLSRSFATAAVCVVFLSIRNRLIKLVGFSVFVVAMIPTGSRAPLLSLTIVSLIYVLALYRSRPNFVLRIVVVGAVVTISLVVVGPQVYEIVAGYLSRGTSANVFQESGRLMLFRHAFQEFLSAPVFGVGLGQFGRADLAIAYQSNFGSYPHNIVLEILSSTGIVGMILFVMVLRPGRWMLHITTPYSILFLLSGLFAMTSGDVVANSGVIIFGVLARLAYYSRRANVSEQPGRALEKSDEGQEDPVHIHGPVPDRHKRKSSQD